MRLSPSEAAQSVWQVRVDRWIDEYDAITATVTEDAVHDFRVASRRLRVSLQLFSATYRNRRFIEIAVRDLRNVARRLGPARDLTIQTALLQSLIAELELGTDLDEWSASWTDRKLKAFHGVSGAVRRYEPLRERLLAFLQFPDFVSTDEPLDTYLRDRLAERAEPLLELAGSELDVGSVDEMHRLRILVKRFRYVLEASERRLPAATKRRIKAAKELQDVLGHLHDWDVLTAELQREIGHLTDRRRLVKSIRVARSATDAAGIESEIQMMRNHVVSDGVLRMFLEIMKRRQDLALHLQEIWRTKIGQLANLGRNTA